MALPIKYNIRNVLVRWRSTIATVLGVALVVAVYMLVQALAVGLEASSASTGADGNLLIMRKGSTAESSSQVKLDQVKTIQYMDGVAKDSAGKPLVSADVLVLINLPRRENRGEANVLIRGVSPNGKELRPQVTLVEGRWFTPGLREVVLSRRLAARFAGTGIGEKFKTGGHELTVVGYFDGDNTAFDSEIWMDGDETRSIFDRENYSSLLIRTTDPLSATNLTQRIEKDKTLSLKVVPEREFYKTQTKTAGPIRFLGDFLATAMSIGAIFAAMNTMYASVGARTREVGTLRVLGYRRRTILISFLIEGAFLALIGGVIGCLLALPMNGLATGTLSFDNFSEVVFEFRISPRLMMKGLIFAVIVGLVGSFLPAIRASRLPVIASLKAL
jgi:putative ABC transport system permease protein